MKKFYLKKTVITKYSAIVWLIFLFHPVSAQVVSLNGVYISISGGTVANADTINNNSASTFANGGTVTISNFNNSGITQGNGTYNIANIFSNTGTFTCGTSTVNYNGSGAQSIIAVNYYNLTASGTRTITLAGSGTIGIANTFTQGSNTYTVTGSTIDFNGSGAQSIPAFSFNNLSASGGNTKTLSGNVNIVGNLTLGANTTLALSSSNITLKSSSTATARVAAVPSTASVTYGTGKFITERYIQGRRKYRLITSPVSTYTSSSLTTGQEALSIWGNWQNSGNNSTANVGTIITGGTSGDGFDQQTSNASLYTYDYINRKYVGFTSANSKTTKYTSLQAGVAYYMFVYGDRLNTVYTSSPNYTVLSSSGTILTGDQTYTTSSTIPLNGGNGKYTMLGNPFASPIDWATVQKTNLANTFWGWDPNLNSTGGYITVNTSGSVTLISPFTGSTGLNQYIQSGQGFFVQATAASPTLTIREQDKVSNYNANAFRTSRTTNGIPLMAINLFYDNSGSNVFADGALAAFDPSFSNAVGKEDASKLLNATENVSLAEGIDLLSIDARQMPTKTDTLNLNITKLTKSQYTLQIFSQQLNTGVDAYLEDKYLKTSQQLSLTDTNRIIFKVNTSDASSNADRFRIVFSKSNLQAVTPPKNSAINVFPNPVTGQEVSLQLKDMEAGHYIVNLFNNAGQQVFSKPIDHNGGSATNTILFDKKFPAGIYYLQFKNDKNSYQKTILIR